MKKLKKALDIFLSVLMIIIFLFQVALFPLLVLWCTIYEIFTDLERTKKFFKHWSKREFNEREQSSS